MGCCPLAMGSYRSCDLGRLESGRVGEGRGMRPGWRDGLGPCPAGLPCRDGDLDFITAEWVALSQAEGDEIRCACLRSHSGTRWREKSQSGRLKQGMGKGREEATATGHCRGQGSRLEQQGFRQGQTPGRQF